MKPLVCIGIAITLVVVSFAVSGQQNQNSQVPNFSPPDTLSNHIFPKGATAVPADPDVLAAERAIYAEARTHEKEARSRFISGDLTGAEQECLASLKAAPVIRGRKAQMPLVQRLLGRIYLREGKNQEALTAFQSCYRNIADANQNLDIAIAYARLGNFEQAKKFYSDRAILRYRISDEPLKPEDLPGTGDLKSLEASALFARGEDAMFEGRENDALDDFLAANRLAPNNTLIAYYCADALQEKGRPAESLPFLEKVAASPRGKIFHDTKGKLYNAQIAQGKRSQAAP